MMSRVVRHGATAFMLLLLALPAYSLDAVYPLPPSEDPFYIPPTGYANRPAGTILRHRKLSGTSANVTIHAR